VIQDWVTPVFLTIAAWVTVQTVCKELPLQNVLLASAIIAALGGAVHWLSQISGVPLGPIEFGGAHGQSPLQEWIPGAALLWVVAVLNARGVARWALRNRSEHPSHGLRVIGVGALLVVVLALGLEPYATEVRRHWLWGPTRLPFSWHGAPISCLFGWGSVSLVALMAVVPPLVNKHPVPKGPRPEPLLIWVAINGLFLIAGISHRLTDVALVTGVGLIWPMWLLVGAAAPLLRSRGNPQVPANPMRG
jgi:amino acid transporter